jgi:VWFA-related protein
MFESEGGMMRSLPQLRISRDYPDVELDRLAKATGSLAHFPRDIEECKQSMKEIAREVSQQYSIGYYPTNTARDGKWRMISVIARQPSSTTKCVARTRPGYYAPTAQ